LRLAEVVSIVFSISGLIVSLALVAAWQMLRPASRAARAWFAAIVLAYAVVSLYPVPHAAGDLLGRGFKPIAREDVPAGRNAVVLLGSGGHTAFDWSNNRWAIVDRHGLARTLEVARVYRLIDPRWVIVSGGRTDPENFAVPIGETMKTLMLQLGVDESRLIVKEDSADTHGEALMVAQLLPSLGVDHVVLVTSRSHIRRAAGAFRAAGVNVIAAPAREDSPWEFDWQLRYLPSVVGLDEASTVAHEVLGLAYYKLKGWLR